MKGTLGCASSSPRAFARRGGSTRTAKASAAGRRGRLSAAKAPALRADVPRHPPRGPARLVHPSAAAAGGVRA